MMNREELYKQIKSLIIQKRPFTSFWFTGNHYLGIGQILTIQEMEKLKADPTRNKELLIFGESANEKIYPINKR